MGLGVIKRRTVSLADPQAPLFVEVTMMLRLPVVISAGDGAYVVFVALKDVKDPEPEEDQSGVAEYPVIVAERAVRLLLAHTILSAPALMTGAF